jgi:cyanate permease
MNMGNQIGAAITATLTPWIAARFGWTTSFLVAAGLCVVGAASWLVVDPTRRLRVFPVDTGAAQIQDSKRTPDKTPSPAARASS